LVAYAAADPAVVKGVVTVEGVKAGSVWIAAAAALKRERKTTTWRREVAVVQRRVDS
jgi:hypothetical protein